MAYQLSNATKYYGNVGALEPEALPAKIFRSDELQFFGSATVKNTFATTTKYWVCVFSTTGDAGDGVGQIDPYYASIANAKSGRVEYVCEMSMGDWDTVFNGARAVTGRFYLVGFNNEWHPYSLTDEIGRVAVSNTITIVDTRLSPALKKLTLERVNESNEPDDEGSRAKVTFAVNNTPFSGTGFSHSLELVYGVKNSSEYASEDLTSYAASTSENTVYIDSIANANDWEFILAYGDTYETVTLSDDAPRAFANVHMSGVLSSDGKQIGGVCFGGFSSVQSTDAAGKFECYFPAYFYAGIKTGGGDYSTDESEVGKWIDGKTIYRKVITFESAGTTAKSASIGASVDTLISVSGAFSRSNGTKWAVNSYMNSSTYVFAWLGSSSSVAVQAGNSMTAGYVVVEYTKQ